MKSSLWGLLAVGALVAFPAVAQSTSTAVTTPGRNTDVVVAVPPSVVFGNNSGVVQREQDVNCLRCCIFDNRHYTEGAVVRTEGVLLQCVRDRQTLGTNNLMWQVLKQ